MSAHAFNKMFQMVTLPMCHVEWDFLLLLSFAHLSKKICQILSSPVCQIRQERDILKRRASLSNV